MRISDWSSDVCSSDLLPGLPPVRCSRRAEDLIFETDLQPGVAVRARTVGGEDRRIGGKIGQEGIAGRNVIGRKVRLRDRRIPGRGRGTGASIQDRKSTRLNSSH